MRVVSSFVEHVDVLVFVEGLLVGECNNKSSTTRAADFLFERVCLLLRNKSFCFKFRSRNRTSEKQKRKERVEILKINEKI